MEVEVGEKSAERSSYPNPMQMILKRQADRKKPAKSKDAMTNQSEVEKFKEVFEKKRKELEDCIDDLMSRDPESRAELFEALKLTEKLHDLQKVYSGATLFLRTYDKKVFQKIMRGLQTKLQALEGDVPKKRFGFKVKERKSVARGEGVDPDASESDDDRPEPETLPEGNAIGISGKSDEEVALSRDVVRKRDVVLKDLRNCRVRLEGVPATVHATNLEGCRLFVGPVVTSVLVEDVRGSVAHLACRQLRVHDTTDSDFYVQVTSTPIIENCKGIRFGVYDFGYDGIDEDFEESTLRRSVNMWDRVDDFNWLVTDKPSPNWSKIEKAPATD